MTWWRDLEIEDDAGPGGAADLVEDSELETHRVPEPRRGHLPQIVSFLNGFYQWQVAGYDGIVPLVRAHAAAAVRQRDAQGLLRTTHEKLRDFTVAPLETAGHDLEVEFASAERLGQPALYLETVASTVRRACARLERDLAELCVAALGPEEWLVVDGLLSVSPTVARHPRALGVIKSHGARFLEGRGLERALTLPAGHRTSVFAVRGGHTRTEVYSWYLRLWPWEGNDLLYGLLRIEARADPDTIARASDISAWIVTERAPLATPATRWDRLLYPLHNVEEYLRSRAPRHRPQRLSRLPTTGS